MNIREFAAKCGVSPATASRVLNNTLENSKASFETYEMIRTKAVEYQYKPNYAAKSLHTHRSNCIGVIMACPIPMNTISILRGVTDCAYSHDVSLSIAFCKNDQALESEAFENMIYRGVDAIVWHPTFQKDVYAMDHIEAILRESTKRIPVVCLSAYAPPDIFKFKINSEEDAASAALRQLKLGCKKFGIIKNAYYVPPQLISYRVYRKTLEDNGVPPTNIKELVLNDPDNPPLWEELEAIDGLWIYKIFALHAILAPLGSVCDLKKLHIDGQSSINDYSLSYWILSQNIKEDFFENIFGSLQYHVIDFEKISYRGTEIAIQAMKDRKLKPFDEPILWEIPSKDYVPPDILFQW
ncbi:MAG: LacI family DNA-binding transcriptional regulator [Thermoguttaceae bacterium]